MPEMHLRQSGFTYKACGPFSKLKKRIKIFKETGFWGHIYQNKLVKAYFQHGMAYGDFKDLNRRTAADKVLRDKAFNIAKDQKDDGYHCGLASMVYKVFDKKSSGGTIKNEDILNKELAEELHKPVSRNSNKIKVHSLFIENIWGADLADMELISRFDKEFRFAIHINSKYARIIPLIDKNGIY